MGIRLSRRSTRWVVGTALTAVAALVLAGGNAVSAPAAQAGYIVQLDEPPLALYAGGIAGLQPTMPAARGATRLSPASAASTAYLAHLASRQNAVESALDLALGRTVAIRFRYRTAYNGLAVTLTEAEAERVAALPGVKHVEPDETRRLLTDAGPAWIGAEGIYGGSATGGLPGTKGEGIVAGIIDTGINQDHPSFADVGGDGYDHINPRTRHYGACAPLNPVLCNDKLIGMYDFTGTTPFDDNAHGSHTASTVAGNVVDASLVAPTITYTRRISGVAPHANLISYKACNSLPAAGGCQVSATVAAIDQATLDGVDVINFSIGGASRNPWTDPNANAFLGANAAGVFGSVSAGNSGPGSSTVGSPSDAPWVMSVGASTHSRSLQSRLVDMAGGAAAPPASMTGKSVAGGVGLAPIVYAGDFGAPLCGAGTADPTTGVGSERPFSPGELAGKIVVCDRGTYGRVAKGQEVKDAGGVGMVLANDAASGASLTADMHALPALHISFADGQELETWLASGTGHTARITGLTENLSPANGDVMAAFSSRGPNPSVPGVIKPDVTAPGVDVYAAFNTPLTSLPPTAPEYGIISGTSMSSPHAAGAAALLRKLKPSWTPSQLKSALMTTGFTSLPGSGPELHGVQKEDAATPATPFELGGGRVELRRAARAGLLLDVASPLAYAQANPALGGDPSTLNLASMADETCLTTCSWTRTVTSAASIPVTWTAGVTSPDGATLTVTPSTFTLLPGASQTLAIAAGNTGLTPNAWRFGAVTLTPGATGVSASRLPVAVRAPGTSAESCVIPDGTVVTDASGDQIPPGLSGAYDIQSLKAAGVFPKIGESANPNIRWTLKVADLPDNAADLPRNATWRITWTAGTRTWFVHMNTFDPTGVAFQYGEITTTASTLGSADDGSFSTDGTIKITIAASKVGGSQAGQTLTAINARTATLVGAAGTGLTVNDDTTGNGTYTLVGCTVAGPDAADDTATTVQGRPVTIPVLANDADPQGDGLTVSAITQPANGIAALNADGTITYAPADEFSGSDTFAYTASDSQGRSDTANVAVSVEPLCPSGSFADDMESGAPGWTTQTAANEAGAASATWAVKEDLGATSPSNSWFSDATTLMLKDDRLATPAVDLTSASRLIFWHRFRLEPGFDGGVLEVSTDGGDTWQDIVDAGGTFIRGGYDGTVEADFGSPIAGRPAWTGGFVDAVTAAMTQVSVDVGALAGDAVLFRFRLVTDPVGVGSLPGHGWWIDDVEVSATAASCNESPTAVDDAAPVDQGNSVEIDVLANDSDPDGDPLTIDSFTDGSSGDVTASETGLVYTHDGSSTAPDSFTYTVSDGNGGSDSATVSIDVLSPAETLESIDADLEELIENDRGRSDKLEDVRAKIQTALSELRKTPPARQAALGAVEGAVGELEAAVASGTVDEETGTRFLERMTGAGRQLAVDAVEAATARGGNAGKIAEAERVLADGDRLRANGSYKSAVGKYKDALAKAEGA